VSFNIFEKNPFGSTGLNEISDERPEVTGIFFSISFSRCGEGGARVRSNEEIQSSTAKWFCGEGFTIRPNRARVQESFFHLLKCDRQGVCLDFTDSDEAHVWKNSFDSSVISPVSKEPLNGVNVFGIIHTTFLL